jgi:hypothetical protein
MRSVPEQRTPYYVGAPLMLVAAIISRSPAARLGWCAVFSALAGC